MSGDYISREAARSEVLKWADGYSYIEMPTENATARINAIPASDVAEVVRCKDCKHRIVNEHYGEKGYLKLKAMCELDTGDPFAFARDAGDDDWYCADGERRDGGPDA